MEEISHFGLAANLQKKKSNFYPVQIIDYTPRLTFSPRFLCPQHLWRAVILVRSSAGVPSLNMGDIFWGGAFFHASDKTDGPLCEKRAGGGNGGGGGGGGTSSQGGV